MATSYTEAYHTGAFLISEGDGKISRENATVASGQNLAAGTVVMDNGSGKLVAHDGLLDTAGDVITAAKGILYAAVDASSGDVTNCTYIARLAEVNDNLITYPTESTAGGEKAGVVASLKLLDIITR